MIAISNHWYIACASSRLRSGPLATRVLEHDLVVFRDARGTAHALRDRCPHRGVALSRGRIVEGAVACGYHGWRFDGEGRCVVVPSLREDQHIPSRSGVASFPCEEHDGYVWVFVGDRAPGPPPRIPEFAGRRWLQGQAPQAFSWIRGIENNLDVCHPGFAHPWTHPVWYMHWWRGLREAPMEVRVVPDGILVFGPATPSAGDAPPERAQFSLRFTLPDRVTVRLGGRFVIVLHFVPVAENACRLEWLTANPLPGPKVWWRHREPVVLAQDRRLLETAQRAYDAEGSGFERSVEGDVPTLLARRAIELSQEGLWEDKRDSLPQRRVFRARA